VLSVDEAHLGTPEATWRASGRLENLRPVRIAPWRRAVVVAPHPDDEVLGAGGLLQLLAQRGVRIKVVAVTDGESSHPRSRAAAAIDLPTRRTRERAQALERLLGSPPVVTRLGLPDGRVSDHRSVLGDYLSGELTPYDVCIAPWWHDGHPDHDAVGTVARATAKVAHCDLLGFLVWAWHWARPEADDLPWDACRQVALTRRETARKRWATAAFSSQIRPLGNAPEDRAVLPDAVLRRSWRRSETFVSEAWGGEAAGGEARGSEVRCAQ
jgi:LmbE family N-acetylglucosaminyl deacetylase